VPLRVPSLEGERSLEPVALDGDGASHGQGADADPVLIREQAHECERAFSITRALPGAETGTGQQRDVTWPRQGGHHRWAMDDDIAVVIELDQGVFDALAPFDRDVDQPRPSAPSILNGTRRSNPHAGESGQAACQNKRAQKSEQMAHGSVPFQTHAWNETAPVSNRVQRPSLP
jgi:hypothetical protein